MKIFTKINLIALIALLFSANAISQTVTVPVSELTTTAKKYSFTYIISSTEKKEIRYICLLGTGNVVKTCFDACDVCYTSDKGYSQKVDKLRCNNCGQVFAIDSLGISQKAGTCNPSYLPHTIEGSKVSIKTDDLIKGAYLYKVMNVSAVEEVHNHDYSIISRLGAIDLKFAESAERNIKIYNINGILNLTSSTNSNEVLVNTSDLFAGVYILSVECNGKIINKLFYVSGK